MSRKMAVNKTFHLADYIIFVLSLVISSGIGIFYALKDKRKQNTKEFLLGGQDMPLFPVALSLLASFLSAISVLGIPAEIYYNGTMYWLFIFGNALAYPVAVHWFIPVFHKLEIASINEYLEMRFNKVVRIIGCLVFQVQMLLYMAVVLYAPALALNQVMGINTLVSILVIGLVCTFYTAIGGLKAVMWTDAFQMFIVFAGLLTLIIKATVEVGGVSLVFEKAAETGKLEIINFDPNPLVRHTFWTLVIGGFMTSMTIYGGNQAMVQRYISMKNVKGAQTALYLQMPASIIFTLLLVFTGLVLNAKYGDKNPVPCTIEKRDQLIPYLVMDVLGDTPGVPGLFVACIFSASLSTVSSGVNALALVFMTDIFKPLYRKITQHDLNEIRATIYSKIIALVYGLLTIALAFLSQYFGSLILQIAISIFGMVGGPLLSLFVLALFFPCVNSLGAIIGLICSLTFTFWLAIGTIVSKPNSPPAMCPFNTTNNYTTTDIATLTSTPLYNTTINTVNAGLTNKTGLETFYSISYLWYSTLAVLVAVVVALVISCATGGSRNKPVDRRLLSPLYLTLASLAKTYQPNEMEMTDKECTTMNHNEHNRYGQVKENGISNVEMELKVSKD